jgi:Zn-finger nucleic acid-binding protein
MAEILVEDRLTVDRCLGCHGVWFDWFKGETSAIATQLRRVVAAMPRARSGGSCPRDGARLVEQPYLDAGPRVDRCPTCMGLFASDDQVDALRAFHERMPESSPEPIERTSLLQRLWHAFAH